MPLPDASGRSEGIFAAFADVADVVEIIESLGEVSNRVGRTAGLPIDGANEDVVAVPAADATECLFEALVVSESLPKNDLLFASAHMPDVGRLLGRAGAAPGAHEAGRSVVERTTGSVASASLLGFVESEIMYLNSFLALSLGVASFPNFPKKIDTVLGLVDFLLLW